MVPDFITSKARAYVQDVLLVQGVTCYVYKDKNTLYASSHGKMQDAGKIAFILKSKL